MDKLGNILGGDADQQVVDLSKVSFFNAVTRKSIGTAENIPRIVRFINNPANLTDMEIALTDVLKEHSGKWVCILYDSISTMLVYLSSPNIYRFIHFITSKIRLMDISGIFLWWRRDSTRCS
jgi:hypothetical protein